MPCQTEIEALDGSGEPWCDIVPTSPSEITPHSSMPIFPVMPEANRLSSAVVPASRLVARQDIMEISIHMPVRAGLYLSRALLKISLLVMMVTLYPSRWKATPVGSCVTFSYHLLNALVYISTS